VEAAFREWTVQNNDSYDAIANNMLARESREV